MSRQASTRWLIPTVLAGIVIVLDQISKIWIVQRLGPVPWTDAIPIAGDWFQIVYSRNMGVAFSLFQGFPQVLTILAIVITCGVAYAYVAYLPNRHLLTQLSIGLIIGGALGNIIDRVRLGYVVDFIQVGWWPVFNVADSAICVGAALLMLQLAWVDAAQQRHKRMAAQ